MRSARVWFLVVGLLSLVFFLNPIKAFAQTTTDSATTSAVPLNNFAAPNMDPNVPLNQHTYAQAVTIEVLSAIMCQITGIDPVDSSMPCLGINPETKRLGYSPDSLSPDASPKLGGILGATTGMISSTFQPPASGGIYSDYLSENFGIVKRTYAAPPPGPGYGFEGLKPIFKLWVAVRDISYSLLIIAFIFIGVGIMLRIKIDPRTVMTIQNQIPKVIICMILITFSYAIAAFMIDLMWVTTYAGINLITSSSPTINAGGEPLSTKATKQLLEIPIVYVNGVFHTSGEGKATASGIAHITGNVSAMVGNLLEAVIGDIFNIHKGDKCFKIKGPSKKSLGVGVGLSLLTLNPIPLAIPLFSAIKGSIPHPGQCVADFLGFVASIIVSLIIFVILIVALFKTWFNLLKAYIYTLLYVIVSPIMIVFGLLPSKPLGFSNWMRRLFVNVAVFPLTAFVIVGARVLMDVYDTHATADPLIPPLIGHNANLNFGSLLAFGALIMTPHLQTILQEKMGVKGIGSPGLVAAGIAGGAGVIGAPAGRAMKHLNRKDSQGRAVGALAVARKETADKAVKKVANSKLPGLRGAAGRIAERREALEGRDAFASEGMALKEVRRARKARNNPNDPYWTEKDRRTGQLLHPEGPPPRSTGPEPTKKRWLRGRKKAGSGSGEPTSEKPKGRGDSDREGGYL